MIKDVKQEPREWEKIFASYSYDKGVISTIQTVLKKSNDGINKWPNELNRSFWRGEVQMANKHEEMFTSFVIGEMQINTILRFHLTPVRMEVIKNTNNNKCYRACESREHFYTLGGIAH